MMPAGVRSARTLAIVAATVCAVAAGLAGYVASAWPQLESESVSLRFALRGAAQRPADVAAVAIDEKTFSELKLQWPFPRKLHAAVIERLHADGASTIVYDVQFTEPSRFGEADDLALYQAIARAGNVVLATTEVNAAGEAGVLGGEANTRRAHAVVATAQLPADGDGVIRSYPYVLLDHKSVAVAAAQADGHRVAPSSFTHGSALIDFRGPPGTIPTSSFSDVLHGRVDPRAFSGKVVVVGASVPTLQDVHRTAVAPSRQMAGVEVQANAIWTALHGNPLRPPSPWLALVAILLAGTVAPLASLRYRVLRATLLALALAAAYLALAQLAFDSGTVLVVSYPLAACALGVVAMFAANYLGAFVERNAVARLLRDSQRELVQRLAQAVESSDLETGEHVRRIGLLCERLALAVGWSPAEAEMLRYASTMHDVGKIATPDRVLQKRGALDAEERSVMQAHTTVGGEILAGSQNPLVQMAATVALCHHERWDGRGYPAGLKGEEIPAAARICSVCDVYDALLSERPYKQGWSLGQTLAELERVAGAQLDPNLVATFVELAPSLASELAPAPGHSLAPRLGLAR